MSVASANIRRIVTVDWQRHQEAQAKALLIAVAREGHRRIMADQAARGSVPSFEAYANRPGRPIEQVILPGPIVYLYRLELRRLVEFILDELRKASPVVSGDYVRGHTLFVNGVAQDHVPVDLSPSDELYIANPVPYARRIEVGRTKSGRSFVMQVPPRIYERVAKQLVISKFRDQAKITFGYVTLIDAVTVTGGLQKRTPYYGTGKIGPRGGGRRVKRRQRVGSKVPSPAIFIKLSK